MLSESKFDFERPMTGLEIEFNLVDAQENPAMRNADVLGAIANDDFQTELGQFNIEINIPPRSLAVRGSSGWIARAVSPSIVSGRVVATTAPEETPGTS